MAIHSRELMAAEAVVYPFPTATVRARAVRQTRAAARRRRLALSSTGLVVVIAFLLAGGPGGSAVASRSSAPGAVVLKPGDTLWELAGRYAPTSVDPRAYVDALIELNSIQGAPLAGQRIKLPK